LAVLYSVRLESANRIQQRRPSGWYQREDQIHRHRKTDD